MHTIKFLGLVLVIIGFACLYASQAQEDSLLEIIPVSQSADVTTQQEATIQLFMYDGCPYCVRVTDFLTQHNLMNKVTFIDAGVPEHKASLRSISGRTQAPYLVDTQTGVAMPESLDIIAYLAKKFSVTSSQKVSIPLQPIVVDGVKKYDSNSFLTDVRASNKPVIILVSTTWCPPCKVFKPLFMQIAQEYAHACEFICIDGDVNSDIAVQLEIQCYPSIVCYKNGQRVTAEDYRSKDGLIKLINKLTAC